MILIGAGITLVPSVWAHTPSSEVQTTEDILKFCEFFYSEYTLLGIYHLTEQHPQFPNLRACEILYNHVAWHSDHWGREKVLISEIEKYLGDSIYIKDRHISKFDNIPNWIKNDAQKWIDNKLSNTEIGYSIRAMLKSELIVLPTFDPMTKRICMSDKMCFREGDYVQLSTNKDDTTTTKRYTINEISDNKVGMQLKTVLFKGEIFQGEEIQQFTATLDSGFTSFINQNGECCLNLDFINQNSIDIGSNLPENDMKVMNITTIPFNGHARDAFIAKDSSGSCIQTIDKETGLILSSILVNYDDGIKKLEYTILSDTNIFERNSNLLYSDLDIPVWFKQNTKWFLDEDIHEHEYIETIKYLVINKIIKI